MSLHVLDVPQYRAPLCGQFLELYGQVCAVGFIIVLAPAVSNDTIMLSCNEWYES